MTDHKMNESNHSAAYMALLLQSGEVSALTEGMLADLSDDQRRELTELQKAMQLLNQAKPTANQAALDSVSIQQDATTGEFAAPRPTSGAIPETLGLYEVLKTVTQGGFGIVVKARDTKLGPSVPEDRHRLR